MAKKLYLISRGVYEWYVVASNRESAVAAFLKQQREEDDGAVLEPDSIRVLAEDLLSAK